MVISARQEDVDYWSATGNGGEEFYSAMRSYLRAEAAEDISAPYAPLYRETTDQGEQAA